MNCSVPKEAFVYDGHLITFPFERNFEYCAWRPWMKTFYEDYIAIILTSYVVTVFGLKYLMRSRQAFDLRRPLITWNLLLALFSTFGAARTIPELIAIWQLEGFRGTMCNNGCRYGVTGLWALMFMLSKIPEFVDTLFIVLRKKPLIFLHYYHHIETCWLCLFGYHMYSPTSRWAVALNYSVHSLMYMYYTIKALNLKTPQALAMSITSLQTLQMFCGVYVLMEVFRDSCGHDMRTIYAGMATYSVYAVLFSRFFYKSYFSKRVPRAALPNCEENNNVIERRENKKRQ